MEEKGVCSFFYCVENVVPKVDSLTLSKDGCTSHAKMTRGQQFSGRPTLLDALLVRVERDRVQQNARFGDRQFLE